MYNASVTFKDSEQERRVFKLFYQVLNGEKKIEEMNVEQMKQELDIEDIAIFFELTAKYLASKVYTPEKEGKTK